MAVVTNPVPGELHPECALCWLLFHSSPGCPVRGVMVTKKKTMKVEAVVLDKDRLDKLIGERMELVLATDYCNCGSVFFCCVK